MSFRRTLRAAALYIIIYSAVACVCTLFFADESKEFSIHRGNQKPADCAVDPSRRSGASPSGLLVCPCSAPRSADGSRGIEGNFDSSRQAVDPSRRSGASPSGLLFCPCSAPCSADGSPQSKEFSIHRGNQKPAGAESSRGLLVPSIGIEPIRGRPRQILSLLRLPVSPRRQIE